MSKEPDPSDKRGGLLRRALGPVTEDFSYALKPIGNEAGETVVAAVRQLIVRPLRGITWGAKETQDYIAREIAKRLQDVPEEDRVEPQPRVAAPSLLALQYSMEESEIRNLFLNLLSSDMNNFPVT